MHSVSATAVLNSAATLLLLYSLTHKHYWYIKPLTLAAYVAATSYTASIPALLYILETGRHDMLYLYGSVTPILIALGYRLLVDRRSGRRDPLYAVAKASLAATGKASGAAAAATGLALLYLLYSRPSTYITITGLVSSIATAAPLAVLYSTYTPGLTLLLTTFYVIVGLYNPLAPMAALTLAPYNSLSRLVNMEDMPRSSHITCIGEILAFLECCPSPVSTVLKPVPKSQWAWEQAPPGTRYCVDTEAAPNRHMLVAGMSGSGKSRLVATAILNMNRRIPVIIVDPHGEYRDLLQNAVLDRGIRVVNPTRNSINPLELAGVNPSTRAVELASLISSLFRLGPLQTRLLEKAIIMAYEDAGIRDDQPGTWSGRRAPTLTDVLDRLQALGERDPRAYTVAPYIEFLSSTMFRNTGINISNIIDNNMIIIVDLSVMPSIESSVLYTDTLLRMIYNELRRRGHTTDTRIALVVDEAHLFAPRNTSTILPKIAAETRKYGVMLVAASQRLSNLHRDLIVNAAYRLYLRTDEPEEARYAARLLAGGMGDDAVNTVVATLARVPSGCAVAQHPLIDTAVIVEVEAGLRGDNNYLKV